MKMNRKNSSQRGFTLIELMVTMLIASVAMLAIASLMIQVISSDSVAIQRSVATHIAEQQLENWYNGTTPTSNTVVTIDNVDYRLNNPDETGANASGVWINTLAGSTTGQVRAVTVYWQHKGRTHSVTATHMQRMS